jgi:hypothetical protein
MIFYLQIRSAHEVGLFSALSMLNIKGYPPENAETPANGMVGVSTVLFHFLEKLQNPSKTRLRRSEKIN